LLFIPCHRVIRSDGLLGGFLAKRGVSLKSKILKIEDSNK
jgi:O6-methylguanine-DNA--protein-cysteine methyltransferase